MSNNLSLKKIQSLGMSKYMSAQELEKSISKALLEQEQLLNQKEDKVKLRRLYCQMEINFLLKF